MALQYGRSRLPELLEARHLSQAEFALLLNASEGLVSKVIAGKSRFSLINAVNAANILKVRVEDLYEWIDG